MTFEIKNRVRMLALTLINSSFVVGRAFELPIDEKGVREGSWGG